MKARLLLVLAVALAAALLLAATAGANSITSPDTDGNSFWYPSLVLDASGNPVVSYYGGFMYDEWWDHDLRVLHCNDPNCTGGDDSVTYPDTWGDVGSHSSLALDASGNPVASYHSDTTSDLKVLHCGNPNCTAGNSMTSPDIEGEVGTDTSLVLDASGNPVVSYYDSTNHDLKLLHCNDPNCAGGDESITAPDTAGFVGRDSSLALDASGNPVVSYWDNSGHALKVMHCNDPNCAGGDESITTPDTGDDSFHWTSLVLDVSGNPVVSYCEYGSDYSDLKLLHCNDPNCAGGDESITMPDTSGEVSWYTSLALDASGNPVVSYHHHYDWSTGDLRVLHCNDPNCAGGDDSITRPDAGGYVGSHPSLALDASGNPVVAYRDCGSERCDLKVLHCDDPNCAVDCVDRLGDTQCDDAVDDPDDDGCSMSEEVVMGFDRWVWYDFYDVPVPAKATATGANGKRGKAVAMDDVLAVLFYVGTYEGDAAGDPNANGVRYDTIKGVDLDGDTTNDIPPPLHQIKEGVKYDRSPSPLPNPPWDAGAPDGGVAMDDVLAVLAQVGLSCVQAP